MLGDKTYIQHVVEEELQTFIEQNKFIYEEVSELLEINGTGSLILEINSASTAFQKAISSEYQTQVAMYNRQSPGVYQRQLGNRIIKLEEGYMLTKALNVIYQTHSLVKEKFAGALFVLSSGAIINPLHPLVALELISSPRIEVSKILIYTYDDIKSIKDRYDLVRPNVSFENDIKMLMQMYQSHIKNRGIKILDNSINMERQQITQKFQVSKFAGEDDTKEYYLAAHQLLTNGTYVPYYGTSLIQMNGTTSGYHLTPFKSCNISGHTTTGPDSVCTGSTSNKTLKGIRTLHHANLGSPYERECMGDGAISYAEECIKQSFSVFKAAKLIPKD